jgi:tRNA A37 threonylcarbamoyltransferase TsaD
MKRMPMALSMSVLVALVALAGCKTTNGGTAQPVAATPVAVARQACVIDALAEERDALLKSIDGETLESDGGVSTTEHRWTILKEKLIAYRAEVEASYRFVTANCNSYNLCMEANNYNEQACAQTRMAWETSHTKFNELAISINRRSKHGHHGGHGGKGGDGCHPSNCGTQGGVFSQGCCYDGD